MAEIKWDDEEHRRCITAGLVQRTYDLEKDQIEGLNRQETLWPESFSLVETMRECECECECHRGRECQSCQIGRMAGTRRCQIYGAIFEYVPPEGESRHRSAPRYIVAFRGTVLTLRDPSTSVLDLCLDWNILFNKQHDRHRFSHARERVPKLLLDNDASHVWLAGHSLGALIALDVGRDMATQSCYVPTFLFNPPQVSLVPGMLPSTVLRNLAKGVVCPASYMLKAVLGTTVLQSLEMDAEELFRRLAQWAPEIYVHESDLICKGFIDYFEQREHMKQRFPCLARSVGTLAYRDMMLHLCAELGLVEEQQPQPHLLPSARLWINSSKTDCPHKLRLWCQPELMLSSKRYSWTAS